MALGWKYFWLKVIVYSFMSTIIELFDIIHSPVNFFLLKTIFQRLDSVSFLKGGPIDRVSPYLRTKGLTLSIGLN
jgi:hypothetical protein